MDCIRTGGINDFDFSLNYFIHTKNFKLHTYSNQGDLMAKFIFVYKGPATDMSDMTEEQSKAVLDAWNQWIDRTGDSLVDFGQPMGNGKSMVDDGTTGTPALLNGYSIVEANDMESAQKLADGHPFLSEGKGNFSIDIYELMSVPM